MISSSIYFLENVIILFLFMAEIKADLYWSIYDSVMVLATDFYATYIYTYIYVIFNIKMEPEGWLGS